MLQKMAMMSFLLFFDFRDGKTNILMHYFAVCYLFFVWNMLFERYFKGLFNAILNLKIEEGKKKQHPTKFRK